MIVALYVVAVFVVMFIISGVGPHYFEWRSRLARVRAFEAHYRDWATAAGSSDEEHGYGVTHPELLAELNRANETAEEIRPWLTARRDEMQRDAEAVGTGVIHVAPPPMIGGGFKRHAFFQDLFDAQTDGIGSRSYRLDDLVTIVHETERQLADCRRDLYNPVAWVRLGFERLVRLPVYVLTLAGFSERTATSTGVKALSAFWSLAVGGATIAGFVLAILH